MMHARNELEFVGLPVFPRRSFRHGFVFVNAEAGIDNPKQLEGRRVGLPEYQQTAALWIRGIFRDEYGVANDQIQWVVGGLHEHVNPERYADELPKRLQVTHLAEGQTLNDMLVNGDIQAIIGAQRPSSFGRLPQVRRLFPDFRRVEQDYFQRTGFFPLMHMIVARRSIVDAHPWIVEVICDAFEQSKRDSDERLRAIADRACALPWLQDDVEEIERIFQRADYRPYGFAKNRAALEKMAEMSYLDGLSKARVDIDGLFTETGRSWQPGA
jgi:4,5-dihydroxyphthalate decarboxylase